MYFAHTGHQHVEQAVSNTSTHHSLFPILFILGLILAIAVVGYMHFAKQKSKNSGRKSD